MSEQQSETSDAGDAWERELDAALHKEQRYCGDDGYHREKQREQEKQYEEHVREDCRVAERRIA